MDTVLSERRPHPALRQSRDEMISRSRRSTSLRPHLRPRAAGAGHGSTEHVGPAADTGVSPDAARPGARGAGDTGGRPTPAGSHPAGPPTTTLRAAEHPRTATRRGAPRAATRDQRPEGSDPSQAQRGRPQLRRSESRVPRRGAKSPLWQSSDLESTWRHPGHSRADPAVGTAHLAAPHRATGGPLPCFDKRTN